LEHIRQSWTEELNTSEPGNSQAKQEQQQQQLVLLLPLGQQQQRQATSNNNLYEFYLFNYLMNSKNNLLSLSRGCWSLSGCSWQFVCLALFGAGRWQASWAGSLSSSLCPLAWWARLQAGARRRAGGPSGASGACALALH